jgi:hypothetical protein
VLRKIYYQNALRHLPSLRPSIDSLPPAADPDSLDSMTLFGDNHASEGLPAQD